MPAAATAFHALIVEDDPSSSDVIARAVRRAHMDPVPAMSVGEALLRVEQEWPPAVILDLRLPDADGTILLRRLKRDARKTHIAVVTGVPDLSRYIDLMHFPPDLLLKKPVDLPKLLHWLRHARAEYEGVPVTSLAPDAPNNPIDPPGKLPSVSTFVDRTQRRREPRFAAARLIRVRPTNDLDAPAHDARLLDAASSGIAIAQPAAMIPGEWFTVTIGAGPRATIAIYVARNCTLLSADSTTYRIGAELVGFVSGPDDDPNQLLATLLGGDLA
jgi:DNA-binding response OmpR family regulator